MTLNLSFHGGAGTVTGSRHLLDTGSRRIQIDCGLFQGLKELRLLNWRKPPYDPASIDQLLLTHAHIDHSGSLPRLVKDGYGGPVHCTAATRDLTEILLLDSAKIQEQDAEYANRKGFSKHKPALPLYTSEDAMRALDRLVVADWNDWIDLGDGARGRFINAGHILGSGIVELRLERKGGEVGLVFSGDVGRYGMPLHLDPSPPPACDVLIVESTYGNRVHDHDPLEDQISEPFAATFERGGVVLMPSFAVGRTQQVTLILRRLMNEGKLPEVPIHIDSPMAVDATRVYSRYLDEHHLDAELVEDGRSRLFPRHVHFHRSVEESKELNASEGPRIIISASGMLSGGRVLHHLRRRLPESRNLVVLVGYQAAGTRGRAMLEGRRQLRIHGRDVPVRAEFMSISGLSAHADRDELLRWIGSDPTRPAGIFVVHGEPEAAQALARRVRQDLGCRTWVPRLDDAYDLEALFEL
jgi:metallo-beta-lactamase family protein